MLAPKVRAYLLSFAVCALMVALISCTQQPIGAGIGEPGAGSETPDRNVHVADESGLAEFEIRAGSIPASAEATASVVQDQVVEDSFPSTKAVLALDTKSSYSIRLSVGSDAPTEAVAGRLQVPPELQSDDGVPVVLAKRYSGSEFEEHVDLEWLPATVSEDGRPVEFSIPSD